MHKLHLQRLRKFYSSLEEFWRYASSIVAVPIIFPSLGGMQSAADIAKFAMQLELHFSSGLQVREALQLQLDVQRRLHDQVENVQEDVESLEEERRSETERGKSIAQRVCELLNLKQKKNVAVELPSRSRRHGRSRRTLVLASYLVESDSLF